MENSIFIYPYQNLRTITLGIVTKHGAASDSIAGTNQVLLQTMVRQSKSYTENKIAKLIDGTGGSLFSLTEKDFSFIGAQVLPNYAISTLELLYDLIQNPTLENKHFRIERDNIIQLEKQIHANPLRRMLMFDADKAVFGEIHQLGRSPIGTKETLSQITIQDLYKLHKKLLENPWGFAVGKMSLKLRNEIFSSFDNFFGSLKTIPFEKVDNKRVLIPKNCYFSPMMEEQNAYLCVNITSHINSDNIGLARYSSSLLGETFGSRMFSILRDKKGFGYVTGSNIKLLDEIIILRCYMETNPKRASEALDELMNIILDLGKNLINDNEHLTNRDYLTGALDLSFDDSRVLAGRIINRITHNLSPDVNTLYQEIEKITPEMVLSWWKSLKNPSNFSIASLGQFNPESLMNTWEKQDIT